MSRREAHLVTLMDLLSYDESHLNINRFWLEALSKIYCVELVCEENHGRELISECEDHVNKCLFLKKNRGWKFVREIQFLALYFRRRNNRVFIMGATGFQIFLLSLIDCIFRNSGKKRVHVFHSELEGLNGSKGVQKKICRFAFSYLGFPRVGAGIVLGEHIRRNLDSNGFQYENIYSIEHPLPAYIELAEGIVSKPWKLAFIGLIRGDTKDLQFISKVSTTSTSKIHVIGRKGPMYSETKGPCFNVVNHHYTESWMKSNLIGVKALLLAPKQTAYKFTASGSITDAIFYSKPVIWKRHDSLQAFESSPFSIVFDSIQELDNLLDCYVYPSKSKVNEWIDTFNTNQVSKIISILQRSWGEKNI